MTSRSASGQPIGQQIDGLRRSNAAAVLTAIRDHGPLSRSEVASQVRLSPAAITKLIGELAGAGYLSEAATQPTTTRGRGRPRRPIDLDTRAYRFVGLHIGVHRVTAGLVDLRSQVVTIRARKHANTSARQVLSGGARLVREVVAGRAHQILGYGVCAGGWVSPETGRVRAFEGLGWQDVDLVDPLLVDDLPAPVVESTVRSLARAEARLAAREGVRHVLYMFVGNVLGCANVVDGVVAAGHLQSAGSIDHLRTGIRSTVSCSCGRRDCLWAVASDEALLRAAVHRGLIAPGSTIEEVVRLAGTDRRPGRLARTLLEQRATRLGGTLAALINIHDPELVVIGGGDVSSSPDHFQRLVSAAYENGPVDRDPVPIRPAALIGPPGLVAGASTTAIDAFFADPLGHRILAPDLSGPATLAPSAAGGQERRLANYVSSLLDAGDPL